MTYDHRTDPRTLKQYEAAEVLGAMSARGDISQQDAQLTLGLVVRLAAEKAPDMCPRGLRARLVWAAKDAASAERLAAIRREKEQERSLVDVAVQGFLRKAPEQAIRAVVRREAEKMTPRPPVSVGDAAVNRARWLARNSAAWMTT